MTTKRAASLAVSAKQRSRARLLAGSLSWLLSGTIACGSANPNLFDSGPAPSGGTNAGNSGGTGSSGKASGGSAGSGGESVAGSTTHAGSGGRGGSGNLGGGDSAGSGGSSAEAGSGSELTGCSAIAANATFLPATGHCYLADTEPRTFALAQAHCKTLDAHLVTLGSEAENDFAWSILSEEHWIGAKDGKAPMQAGVGIYAWLTGEPFDYDNWSAEQPNANAAECEESNGGGTCYEHCGCQWTGGEHDGQWNDRYCLVALPSICEWDSAP